MAAWEAAWRASGVAPYGVENTLFRIVGPGEVTQTFCWALKNFLTKYSGSGNILMISK